MKKSLFAVVALATCLICASCNNSHKRSEDVSGKGTVDTVSQLSVTNPDLTFFELHGPVKKMSEDFLVYEFDENGNLTRHNGEFTFSRDKQGRIVKMNGYENHVTYLWDSERPIGSEAAAEGMSLLESYTYDNRGFVVKIKHTEDGEVSYETLSYSGLDKYGNWTKRSSEGYEYGRGSASRTIEYYE
ncbi:MAG: hypothetical protein IKQ75_09755 [Bacteroidales bacterium]|nr:hypothetical protein [Bacteroidales bacterium]MBR6162130.1 hypothetical protein [Bacteroidales bacterium]